MVIRLLTARPSADGRGLRIEHCYQCDYRGGLSVLRCLKLGRTVSSYRNWREPIPDDCPLEKLNPD